MTGVLHVSWPRLVICSWCLLSVPSSSANAEDSAPQKYALTSKPLEIYEQIADLKLGDVSRLSDEERTLLLNVWELHPLSPEGSAAATAEVDQELLLEALLFASAVEDAAKRKLYREQFRKVAEGAQKATKDAKTPREQGEQLMQFLHAGVMQKGYELEQTSFSQVFDSAQYNCVSSSAMYFLIGTRLGLKLQPVSIPGTEYTPGHATLDLLDGGERIQVEPTNPDGFDWQTKVNQPGVTVIGLVPDREKAHDTDAWGLAAMIYSNRGTALSKQESPDRFGAARCYVSALACDPLDESATNNLLALFTNWGPALTNEKKFEDALRVMALGLKLSPRHRSLEQNRTHAWVTYLDSVLEEGEDERAVELVQRAAKETDESDLQHVSDAFIRFGEKRRKEDWEAALLVADRGLKVAPEAERKKLLEWRTSVFRQRSQWLLEEEQGPDVDGSLQVLARAYDLDPADEDIIDGIAYHTQQALELLESKSGVEPMIKHYAAIVERFPRVKEIPEAGRSHAFRGIKKLADAEKFSDAMAAVDTYRAICSDAAGREELAAYAYDLWAQNLAGKKEWEAALKKCAEGISAFPKQEAILNRLRITVDDWAKPKIDVNDWDAAIGIYDVGLKYAKDDEHLLQNRKYCEQQKANSQN